jgi:hypothetical protein
MLFGPSGYLPFLPFQMGKKEANFMPFEIDFRGLDYPIIITIKGVLTINEFVETILTMPSMILVQDSERMQHDN